MKLMSKDIRPNTSLTTFFALESIQMRMSKDQRHYLALDLYDRTGRIRGLIWNKDLIERLNVTEDSFVRVKGMARMVNEDFMVINIDDIRTAEEQEIEISDFLGIVPKGIEYWKKNLVEILKLIHEKSCFKLILAFLEDNGFLKEFTTSFGGLSLHHNYMGGLLEHTVSTMREAYLITEKHPGLFNRDLLLTGAFLHDIGKIREIKWMVVGEYTTEGKLLGHIPIGLSMLEEKLLYLGDFPEEPAMLLKHMILSHHGSPVRPSTPEAILLHSIEGMDARINHLYYYFENCHTDKMWSHFDKFFKTKIYQGGYFKKNLAEIKKKEVA